MELRLYIRQLAVFNTTGQQIYYSGTNPFNLQPIIGTLPVARQWKNYPNWIDVTKYVSDLHKLKLGFSSQRDGNGNIISSQNQLKKVASGMLTFERLAYDLLKAWLIEDISAPYNGVEVMIEHVGCGQYHGFAIKGTDINWCEGNVCEYQLVLKQNDDALNCIKRTIISDNWQGWFPEDGKPLGGKKHPRFSYCNEIRPNSTLVLIWYTLTTMFATSIMFIIPILLTINPLLWILNQIENILNASWNIPPPISLHDIMDGVSTIYIESAGCGREHPAPLIRDYITNVCDKCGVVVNAQTAPIFFAPVWTIETSNGITTELNHYIRACYFNAPVKRGIRRFERMSINFGFEHPSNEYWIDANRPLKTLDMFLDEVCPIFNHEWKLINGELHIKRKDELRQGGYIFDFVGADSSKIVEGFCFDPTGDKLPASCVGMYSPDGADSCGNEAGNINGTGQMNGVVEFNKLNSPNAEGILNKSVQFGATRFRFDGVSGDYIYDAIQVILNGQALSIPGTVFSILQEVEERLSVYADFVLLLQSETAILPKILIWDGESYENARAVITKAAWDGVSSYPMPDINPNYNTQMKAWKVRHHPDTNVIGRGLTLPASPSGIYRVTDYIGLQLAEQAAHLVNYPMYFEPYYKETLWDKFHWIDDPETNPYLGYRWRVKIKLCCEDLVRIGVFGDNSAIVLNEKVKLPFGYFNEGVITEININYDPSDEMGRYIELIGKV